jgi:hypothetical protein
MPSSCFSLHRRARAVANHDNAAAIVLGLPQLQIGVGVSRLKDRQASAKRKAALRRLGISKLMFLDQANFPLPDRRLVAEEDLLTN